MSKSDDDAVGYGKPPKHTQFKKGQSGNPSGRKRKAKQEGVGLPALLPTSRVIQAEAARPVIVRDGENRHAIPTSEAVMRALARNAMQGGVLAQRTYLELQMREDEREASRRRRSFEFWEDYLERARGIFAQALARGDAEPPLLPHPDDIQLNYRDLSVAIAGPIDEEEVARAAHARRLGHLFLELKLYNGEDMHLDDEYLGSSKIGFFLLMHVSALTCLPPRLRVMSPSEQQAILLRAVGPRRRWRVYLQAQCEACNIPFLKLNGEPKTFTLGELGDGA